VESVVVPAADGACVLPFAAQGCRPIGEPLTVTRADHNILYSLGGQPAYRVLERAFETLSDDEKSRAKGNLFAGLAGNEYLEEFRSGDFLIKNIIGADPDSGAVVIGGLPRIGQTLQYQIRNRESALADLQRAFKPAGKAKKRAVAALLFSCVGRGANFFGVESPDASGLRAVLGRKPAAGFLSAAEIAPVAGTTALHGYTAVAAVFARKEE
jgi:small ligand-binding sensory domain FIST